MSDPEYNTEIISPPDGAALFQALFGVSLAYFDIMCEMGLTGREAMEILQGKPIWPKRKKGAGA